MTDPIGTARPFNPLVDKLTSEQLDEVERCMTGRRAKPIGTAQERELIERLREPLMGYHGRHGRRDLFERQAAAALQSRIVEVGRLTERVREAMDHLFNAADLLEAEGWKAVASEKREIAQSLKAALSLQRRV